MTKVWLAQFGISGCMPSYNEIAYTKKDAIEQLVALFGDDYPRGLITTLRKYELWYDPSSYSLDYASVQKMDFTEEEIAEYWDN